MRTTVNIDDQLLALAKERAHREHSTLGAVIEAALHRHLAVECGAGGPPIPVFTRGTGARPGIDLCSNRSMFEAIEEDVRDTPDTAAS